MADSYKAARKLRKKFKTQRKTALTAGDVTGANKAARRMRKHGNVMRKLKGKDVKGKIPTRTTRETKKKVVPAVTAVESAKTHGDVWDKRWAGGGLDKTFGTKSSYGLSTRPDRWRDYAQGAARAGYVPEYRTGPGWDKKTGWQGPEKGRWWYDAKNRQWRRMY